MTNVAAILKAAILNKGTFFKWQVGRVTYETTRECSQKVIKLVRFDLSAMMLELSQMKLIRETTKIR